jgi:hypothetical protein
MKNGSRSLLNKTGANISEARAKLMRENRNVARILAMKNITKR